jgi:YbbR domain-containing protein
MNDIMRRIREGLIITYQLLRQAVVSFRYNWGIALLSIALAISLWVFVTDQEDVLAEGRVPGSIPVDCVNVPSGKATAEPCLETKSVTIRVEAPESVLDDLTDEDFTAQVDLSDMTTDEASLPVRIESSEPRVEVLEIVPAQVTIRLEDVTFRTVPVVARETGELPEGFDTGEIVTSPTSAIITGPERAVANVEAVVADVDLTGQQASFERTFSLQARDGQGNPVAVNIEPEQALVNVEITQLISSQTYVVHSSITGIPAAGFSISAIEIEPPVVTVSGSQAALQGIDPILGVSTDQVSVEGASADVVRTVRLQLPEGATVDQEQVTVRVVIGPTAPNLTLDVPVRAANVGAGLRAALDPAIVSVTVTGSLAQLAGVTADDISVTVNLQGLTAGVHTVPVVVTPPTGLSSAGAAPANVSVTLSPS